MLLLLALGIIFVACIPLIFLPTPPPRPGQPIYFETTRKPTAWETALWCDKHGCN